MHVCCLFAIHIATLKNWERNVSTPMVRRFPAIIWKDGSMTVESSFAVILLLLAPDLGDLSITCRLAGHVFPPGV